MRRDGQHWRALGSHLDMAINMINRAVASVIWWV
jgi:hypothetical protein